MAMRLLSLRRPWRRPPWPELPGLTDRQPRNCPLANHCQHASTQCQRSENNGMDTAVLNSIDKWPNVPDVYGWLSLGLRGNWIIKGSAIANPGICEFIGRNYSADTGGRWYFQNGPQRVFASLAYAPFVLRTEGSGDPYLTTHTGLHVHNITGAWIDETGKVIIRWPAGLGTISDRDLSEVANWMTNAEGIPVSDEAFMSVLETPAPHGSAGFWFNYRGQRLPVERVLSRVVPQKFAFERSPLPAPGQPDC
jgi:hypothetical protein